MADGSCGEHGEMPSAILLPRFPGCGCACAALGAAPGGRGARRVELDCVSLKPRSLQQTACACRCCGRTGLEPALEHPGLNPGSAPYSCVTLGNIFGRSVKGDHSNPSPAGLSKVVSEKAVCQRERVQALVSNRHGFGHQECNPLQGAWHMEQCLGNHPLVIEDLLGAGAVENWLQDCAASPLRYSVIRVSSLSLVMSAEPPTLKAP